jgi:hypothetical protein
MLDSLRSTRCSARHPALASSLGLILLIPAIACAGSVSSSEEGPSSQADLVARLPADAITIGFIDFMTLRESPVYDFAREEGAGAEDGEEFQEFIRRTGIDPRTDIHRIAFAAGPLTVRGPRTGAAIVVATFDRTRLETSLAGHESTSYAGHTIWSIDDGEGEGEDEGDDESMDQDDAGDIGAMADDGYLAILDDDTVAFGNRHAILSILDVAGGAASARTNEVLMALLDDVAPDSDIWMVSAQDRLLDDLTPGGEDRPTPQIPIDKIRSMILSIQLAGGIGLELRGRTADRADAQLLGDSLNGMLAFGKMMLQSNSPEIFAILDRGVRAGSSGQDVTVRADLSMDDLRALGAFARETTQSDGPEIGR